MNEHPIRWRCEGKPSSTRGNDGPAVPAFARGIIVSLLFVAFLAGAANAADPPRTDPLIRWQWFRPIQLPVEGETPWIDFLVTPSIFTRAQVDLDDLRIYDGSGREIPFALRVRREQYSTEQVSAEIFNRAVGPQESRELSLDLGESEVAHNEVEVGMAGQNFRRRAVLEGSPDGDQWRTLTEEYLIYFLRGDKELKDVRLNYPPSRFRYLRLRVFPDPAVDETDERVAIDEVTVRRRIALPGEDLELPGQYEPREPTRENNAPASAWIIHLGGENVPVERLEVEFAEDDFVRDYVVQFAGPPGPNVRFQTTHADTWRRREGEERKPLVAEFSEVRAARLRLIVIDHSNPPLTPEEIRFAAAARQVVLPRPSEENAERLLYYGNPDAIAPRYDFARNLPDRLEPPPARTTLGSEQENPGYVPEPLPVTERWPWLTYVVLSAVSLVLAGVIVSVARTTIALRDSE